MADWVWIRRFTTVLAALGLLAAGVVPAASASAAGSATAVPPASAVAAPACVSQHAGDACSLTVLDETAGTATVTFTIVYVHPRCTEGHFTDCFTDIYMGAEAAPPETASFMCPGMTSPSMPYYPWTLAPDGAVTCTATFAWTTIRAAHLYVNAVEENTDSPGLFLDSWHNFHVQLYDYPVARFTSTTVAGAPSGTLAFDATKSSVLNTTIASYGWDFGDGTHGTGATMQHRFPASGVYPVTLVVTAANSKQGSVTHRVTVVRGSLRISAVTIAPLSPTVVDRVVTGTVTVVNDGYPDALTSVAVGVSSATPAVVTVRGGPSPASLARLAGHGTARFTFRLVPHASGQAVLRITAHAMDSSVRIAATPRTRVVTIGSAIRLTLARTSGPDAVGRATVRATVRNFGRLAVGGVVLRLADTTGARIAARLGRPAPGMLTLGGRQSASFLVRVTLPLVGSYHLVGSASGRVLGALTSASAALTLTRTGVPLTASLTPQFAVPQIGQPGRVVVRIVNHLNENLAGVTAVLTVPVTTASGRATLAGAAHVPATIAAGATVYVPATLTFPGKVTFRLAVAGHGARTRRAVSVVAAAGPTVTRPVLTAKANTATVHHHTAFAQDYAGSSFSTAGGPIALSLETTVVHTYSQRASFNGTVTLPFWPHHAIAAPGAPVPPHACWATFSAQQGAYKATARVYGTLDRRLLFADAAPGLASNMLLCKNELAYVDQTPGTAMYLQQGPGKPLMLVVQQQGHGLEVRAYDGMKVCVGLTDGIRSVRVVGVGSTLTFTVVAARCGT